MSRKRPALGVDPECVARAIAPWFARTSRDLSWRKTRDPYAIWVSEVMLQQTRVDTVERFYGDFMDRFPDVGTLAAADEDEVLHAWSGLGYYRRARLLHRGARRVVEAFGGELPNMAGELREIPGVGRYTAGAIASIAFDRPAPLVDGNVARVLSRLHAIEDPREQDAKAARHWNEVEAILQHGSPRVLAQALMELGATVCTPSSPKCPACPLRERCQSQKLGVTDRIPTPRERKPSPKERYCAIALSWRDRILLVRRPDEGLLAKMWCLPLVRLPRRGKAPRTPPVAATRALLGVAVKFDSAPLASVRHVFTHRVWELFIWTCRCQRKPRGTHHAWIRAGERAPGGTPSITNKLLARIRS